MTTIKNIVLKDGKQLILRNVNVEDAEKIVEYLNIVGGESDNLLFGAGEFRLTVEQEREFIDNANKNNNSLMIIGLIDNKVVSIGIINCLNRKRISHNSELSLSVKKDYWNLGIGSAVLEELIMYAKKHDLIKNINLSVKADNFNAIKLYEKYGFVKVGIHKNYVNIDGKYYDQVLMDLQIK